MKLSYLTDNTASFLKLHISITLQVTRFHLVSSSKCSVYVSLKHEKCTSQYHDAITEIFMAFWVVTLCDLTGEYQHPGGMCIHIQDWSTRVRMWSGYTYSYMCQYTPLATRFSSNLIFLHPKQMYEPCTSQNLLYTDSEIFSKTNLWISINFTHQ
jgi:hypothetical protein